jgi:hypothetical protein
VGRRSGGINLKGDQYRKPVVNRGLVRAVKQCMRTLRSGQDGCRHVVALECAIENSMGAAAT